MKIQENDFIVDHNGNSYVLHLKKTKGELKEDPESNFKVGGYQTELKNSLRSALRFRRGKKYPFKESKEKLKSSIDRYVYLESQFQKEITKLYKKILTSKKDILNGV